MPCGSTAMLDAVGKTIVSVGQKLAAMKEEDRPCNVVVTNLQFVSSQINTLSSSSYSLGSSSANLSIIQWNSSHRYSHW